MTDKKQTPISLDTVLSDLLEFSDKMKTLRLTNPAMADQPEVRAKLADIERRVSDVKKQLVSFDRAYKDTVKLADSLGGEVDDRQRERVGRIIAQSAATASGRKRK